MKTLTCLLCRLVDIIASVHVIVAIYIIIMIISIHVNWTLRWRIAEAIVNVVVLIRRLIRFKWLIDVAICTITRTAGIIIVMIFPSIARPCVNARWRSCMIVTGCWWWISCCLSSITSAKHFKYHFGITRWTAATDSPMKIVSRWCC